MLLKEEREQVVEYCKALINKNLTTASGGNISIYNREKELIALSPSGMDYFKTEPEDIVVLNIDGEIVEGDRKPSSELDLHLIFYRHREEINSIVHTHSTYATAIACMGWSLPAIHYLVGLGGKEIQCAPYALYGTKELAENAFKTMGKDTAVLLKNHGLLALGEDIEDAFTTADQLEFVAKLYCVSKTLGNANILSDAQMTEVIEKFNA